MTKKIYIAIMHIINPLDGGSAKILDGGSAKILDRDQPKSLD